MARWSVSSRPWRRTSQWRRPMPDSPNSQGACCRPCRAICRTDMNPFFQLALAVAVSVLVIPLVRQLAPQLGLVDMPDPRKVHTVPIPRVGGWGITLGILLPLVIGFKLDPLLQSFLIGCVILFAFGI